MRGTKSYHFPFTKYECNLKLLPFTYYKTSVDLYLDFIRDTCGIMWGLLKSPLNY